MKKLLVIMLLIMYGTSSMGMTVHFHYCCGKLKKVDFTPPKDKHCGSNKPHQMGAKPCCENKQVEMKVKGEQEFAKVFSPSFAVAAIKPALPDFFVSVPFQTRPLIPEVFAPPPLSSSLFVLHCVFRI